MKILAKIKTPSKSKLNELVCKITTFRSHVIGHFEMVKNPVM